MGLDTWTCKRSPEFLAKRLAKHAQVDRLRAYTVPAVKPADLARKAEVSRQYVSDVLNGRTMPSEKLLAAARELGIPV